MNSTINQLIKESNFAFSKLEEKAIAEMMLKLLSKCIDECVKIRDKTQANTTIYHNGKKAGAIDCMEGIAALAKVELETILQPKAPTYAWECNECGAQEYNTCISEEDVHELGCSNCGSSEWHKAVAYVPI